MTLDELKNFLRVDDNALDAVLEGYQLAAEVYLTNAGVTKDYSNALYKIVITIFVGYMLENPNLAAAGVNSSGVVNNMTLTALIAQLRLSQGV